jgi:hypothetical protein
MKRNMIRTSTLVAASLATIAISFVAYAPSALACGGTFCSAGPQSQPVNQTAERIIFAKNPDNTVTAVVEIRFEGDPDEFAWLLPVPGVPEVELSSTMVLDRLQRRTNPVYQLNSTTVGSCKRSGGTCFGPCASEESFDSGAPGGGDVGTAYPEVNVLSSGTTGPYDYTTISVDQGTENPEDAALGWLDEQGFNTPQIGPGLLRDYLDNGMNLLAVRLTKDADAGKVRPIRLTYDAELPMIPIELTAVAAQRDMGVMVWVLGESRAVPTNYKSLQLNEAAINWFNPGASYVDVVNRAADEAGGQGFVTEFAFPTEVFTQQFGSNTIRTRWAPIADQDWSGREGELLQTLLRFSGREGFDYVIDNFALSGESITSQDLVSLGSNAPLFEKADLEGLDPTTLLEQFQAFVIDPVAATMELIGDRAYMTRLYTTMSPADMTLDPVFDFNPDLPDVSNSHSAERTIHCSKAYRPSEAPWEVEFDQGTTIWGEGTQWPQSVILSSMPANYSMHQHDSRGDGEVVADNEAEINQTLDTHNDNIKAGIRDAGCGCSSTGSGRVDGAALILVVGFLMVGVARRRRRD